MQSRTSDFIFSQFNFAKDSVFNSRSSEFEATFPPVAGDFLLLDGTDFLLLDNTNFLLL